MDRPRTSTSKMQAVLSSRDLVLVNGEHVPDIDLMPGLSLVHCPPLFDAATLTMTLGGRLASKAGNLEIKVGRKRLEGKKVARRHIALAGVPEVDALEPMVSVRSVVREHVVWTSRWWQGVPKELSKIERFQESAKLIQFEISDEEAKSTTVASLDPLRDFQLRIALALTARPEASLLLVNDIESVRNVKQRRELFSLLRRTAESIPVAVLSANEHDRDICDHYIDLAAPNAETTTQETKEAPEPPKPPKKPVPEFQKPRLDYRRQQPRKRIPVSEFQKPKRQFPPIQKGPSA